MPGRQAKIISSQALRRTLAHVRRSNQPERNVVIVLLSVRAGLRACEIAGLEWSMVLDARGRVGSELAIEDRIAKKRSGRRVPLHLDLRNALAALRRISPPPGAIIRSARGGNMRPNSIVNWFVTLFGELDLVGCSSHSGRRSFITAVQLLAGHRSIETTQSYIDGDTKAQRRIIALI
jgi:integrase